MHAGKLSCCRSTIRRPATSPAPRWQSGLAFATGVAIGSAVWGGVNWGNNDINVNINNSKTINKWERNSSHRRGVQYKAILDGADRVSTQILTNTYGRPWSSDGFRTSWGKICIKAGLAGDLHFHDLRGSAVVRLAIAGATVPEIATFTGHALKDVEAILDTHYLGRDLQLAENAMRKLERKEKRTKTVKCR